MLNIIYFLFFGGNICIDIVLDLMLDELNYFKFVLNGKKVVIGVIFIDGLLMRFEFILSLVRRIYDVGYWIVVIGNLI